jgi:sulfur-carrier protein
MRVEVKALGDVRRHVRGRPEPLVVEVSPGSTVAHLLDTLGIPTDEALVVGVNGSLGDRDHALADGDAVMLVTPMAGGSEDTEGRQCRTVTGTASCGST